MSKNRTWVLLRGLVREQRHWQDFPDKFRLFFPDDRLVFYDFPGNGQRHQEKSVTSIAEMVNGARIFVREQSINEPVHILALSLGAMVAVEWMARHPDECAASVLISTSLRGLNPFYHRLLPATYPAIFKSLFMPGSIRKNESVSLKFISNIVANDNLKSEATVDDYVSYAQQCPVSGINGLRQLLAASRFHVPEKCPQAPILVLNSNADRLVSPQCSVRLANYWNLPIDTHKTAGHDLPLDDGEWVCEKINRWIKNSG